MAANQSGRRGWVAFGGQPEILSFEYSFGPGLARSIALPLADGLAVVSPPSRPTEEVFKALASHGPVRALVAPNAFHTLGLTPWKMRFPDAALYAPVQSIPRVQKQTGLAGLRPVAELSTAAIEFTDMPHYKTGEALVRIRTEAGLAWYVTDVILNMPELPTRLLPRLLFGLSRSAPGLRYNNVAPLFMVADKAALRRWLAEEFRKAPPRWLIPAHGDIVDFQAEPALAGRLF